jgi:6-phosphogluconolactonase (cycloisomerase 2 family)
MSFLGAACAAQTAAPAKVNQSGIPQILAVIVVVLSALCLSCGSSYSPTGPNHNAYVTLPGRGSVMLLRIDGSNGVMTQAAETPQVQNTAPTGIALLPSKKFLYVVNSDSRAYSISTFSVASDGTLTLTGPATPVGFGPNRAVVDPSGQYLLVTQTFSTVQGSGFLSVYSIDPGTGALSQTAGSPYFVNSNPTEILITPSGRFVYVTNQNIGMVTAFTFSNGVLTQVATNFSGAGATGLAVDASEQHLYVANLSAPNPPPNSTTKGNISAFNIDQNTGALSLITGSPFAANNGNGPSTITVDPTGKFVYAATAGSSFAVWCFTINQDGGLTSATNSPFSEVGGGLFSMVDPSGNFYYIGGGSGTSIAGYTYNSSTGALTIIEGSPFSTITAPGKMVLSE